MAKGKRRKTVTVPVGQDAKMEMKMEDSILRFFPPVSPMQFDSSSGPWVSAKNEPKKSAAPRCAPAHSGTA